MNDMYLYRAKRTDNRGWAEGFLYIVNDVPYILPQIHVDNLLSTSVEVVLSTSVEVQENTICKCTGIMDKNGNLINLPMTLDECRNDMLDYEIIGNIFDNPELLEVGE